MLATALLIVSCSSDSTLEEEHVVDTRQPMVFGTSSAASETTVTRAEYLTNDFKVNTWKNFGNDNQQVVMNGYQVKSQTSTSTTIPYTWYYENVNSQVLRYWDLSAFPYEFRAVTPYDATGNSATIADDKITLNASSTPFKAQTYIDGTKSSADEPFMVSHVTRVKSGTDFVDTDVIKNAEINTNGKADATRGVHMPFHHIISKVGFRLYINDPQPTAPDYKVFLNSIKISVVNADNNFITQSNTYTATNSQGLGKGTFSDNTTPTGEITLLEKTGTGGKSAYLQSDNTTDVDFRQHLNKDNAFDLCSGSSTSYDYLHQIPQSNIKLRVQLKMETDHITSGTVVGRNPFEFDVLLSLDKTVTTGDNFTWDPDYRYIYYLHIPNLHGHVIELNTCEILPWDEVQTTDIPIEL